MSGEKQIEEMAKDLFCSICWTELEDGAVALDADRTAINLHNAGYHKQEWISVGERLPEPHTLVLCIWTDILGSHYGFARYQREDVWYVSNEGMPNVTHWMPLPDAPKMKGGE